MGDNNSISQSVSLPKKEKSIISFLVDHASPEVFFKLIDDGNAPSVSKYILGVKQADGTYSNATISRNVVTGYPSTSANSHTSILTGSYASKTGLLYGVYWDCTGKKPQLMDTEEISVGLLKDMNEKFISKHVKTLFEHVPDSASFHAINRGARIKMLTTGSLLTKFLPLLIKMKGAHDPNKPSPMGSPELWKSIFLNNIEKYLLVAKQTGNMPKASFIAFILSDENAHKFGFDSAQYQLSIQILDFFVQILVEGFDNKKGIHIEGFQELGLLDSIIWNINTDHAGRPVIRDKKIAINTVTEFETGLRMLQGPEEKEEKRLKEYKGVLTGINAFSQTGSELWHGWFGGPEGTKTTDFSRFYGEKYFRSIIPKHAIKKNDLATVDFIKYLTGKDYISHIIIPEEDISKDFLTISPSYRVRMAIPRVYSIKLINKDGISEVTRSLKNGCIHYSYDVLSGEDPLDYQTCGLEYNEFYPHQSWLEKTISLEFPDVFHRMFGFFDCRYAPNIAFTSEFDWHFMDVYGIAHSKQKAFQNVQSHDGLYRVESVVPSTFAGPGVKKGGEIKFGRNIDVLPTMLKLLDVDYDEAGLDGKVLEDVLE